MARKLARSGLGLGELSGRWPASRPGAAPAPAGQEACPSGLVANRGELPGRQNVPINMGGQTTVPSLCRWAFEGLFAHPPRARDAPLAKRSSAAYALQEGCLAGHPSLTL